jgi:hypothetical protein
MRLLLPLLCLPLAACSGAGADYFRIETGLTWEYSLVTGGVQDEVWRLEIVDAEENPANQRGQLWWRIIRSEPHPDFAGERLETDHRSFNVGLEEDQTGSEPVPIGWTYRHVELDEGDRNEFFVKVPEGGNTWSDTWSYTIDDGGSEFDYSVEIARGEDTVQTGLGNYDDTVRVVRTTVITNTAGGNDQVLTQVHEEHWARDVGLVRYRFTAADGEVTDAALRTADTVDL